MRGVATQQDSQCHISLGLLNVIILALHVTPHTLQCLPAEALSTTAHQPI